MLHGVISIFSHKVFFSECSDSSQSLFVRFKNSWHFRASCFLCSAFQIGHPCSGWLGCGLWRLSPGPGLLHHLHTYTSRFFQYLCAVRNYTVIRHHIILLLHLSLFQSQLEVDLYHSSFCLQWKIATAWCNYHKQICWALYIHTKFPEVNNCSMGGKLSLK